MGNTLLECLTSIYIHKFLVFFLVPPFTSFTRITFSHTICDKQNNDDGLEKVLKLSLHFEKRDSEHSELFYLISSFISNRFSFSIAIIFLSFLLIFKAYWFLQKRVLFNQVSTAVLLKRLFYFGQSTSSSLSKGFLIKQGNYFRHWITYV